MSIPLDLLERYANTMMDFWRLGSSNFLSKRQANLERYLPPYQFLSLTLGALFSMCVAGMTLNLSGLRRAGIETFDDPKALAARNLVFLFCCLVCGTLMATFVSRLWPVRKKPSLVTIFHFSCYYYCLILPFSAMDIILTPILVELAAEEAVPLWVAFIPMAIGYLAGSILFFVYWLPGIAFINDVSKKRMLAAMMLWPNLILGIPAFWVGVLISISSGDFSRQYDEGYARGYKWGVETRRKIETMFE